MHKEGSFCKDMGGNVANNMVSMALIDPQLHPNLGGYRLLELEAEIWQL